MTTFIEYPLLIINLLTRQKNSQNQGPEYIIEIVSRMRETPRPKKTPTALADTSACRT